MPAELVRSGELPATILPSAHIRLLPRVSSEVRLEVRGLGVCLVALGARMHHRLLGVPPTPLLFLDLRHHGCGMKCRGIGGVILVTVVTIMSRPMVTRAPGVDVEVDIDVKIHSWLLIMITLMMIGMVILRMH